MTNWPAVIKYDGDDELTYIGSDEESLRDAGSHCYPHNGDDCLIDSSADIFSLDRVHDDTSNLPATGKQMALRDFIRPVRIHAPSSQRCCIEKITIVI